MTKSIVFFSALLSLVFTSTGGAFAEEVKEKALPGVSGGHKIVTDLPAEPSDDPVDPGYIKVGDTEVRISGYVRFEATTAPGGSKHR